MAKVVIDPNTAKEDRRRARMGALAVTLTKTDRILTGRDDVTCAFYMGDSPSVDAPAWNDGKRITIHGDKLPSIESASGLVTTLGLNHHEVAHILFSLGNHTPFIQTISRQGYFAAYNLLEDMRIETLLSAQYVSMKKYLTAPVLHFIVEEEAAWPTAHLLTYGRRFLPLEIRKEFRKRFVGSASLRREAEQIIDEFRVMDLSDVNLHTKAGDLVERFHKLLESLNPKLDQDQQDALNDHKGCNGVGDFTNDRAKVAKAERDARRRDEEDEDAADGEYDDGDEDEGEYDEDGDWNPGGSGGDDSEDDGKSDPSESGSGRGKGSPDKDKDAGGTGSGGAAEDEEDDADEAGSAGGGPGSSDGGDDGDEEGDSGDVGGPLGGPGGMSAAEVANLINEALDAVEGDSEVQEQITRLQSAMNDVNNMDAVIPDEKYRETAPSASAVSASAMVIREFQVLNTPFEAGWEYGTDYGRVNVQRAIMADFGDTDIYDAYEPGREADAAMEIVVLLDKSGSMSSRMASACEAAWVVARGAESVDAKITVLTFGDDTMRLYQRGENSHPNKVRHPRDLQGATYPDGGLAEARMILNQSERPNRLLVLVTDGGFTTNRWDPRHGYGARIDYKGLLESVNATRVYVGIRTASSAELEPCYDVCSKIETPDELVTVVRQAVRSMLDEAWKRR